MRACVQALDRGVADFVFGEARIDYFNCWIGIEDGSFPFLFLGKRQRIKRQSCCRAGGDVHEGASFHRDSLLGRFLRGTVSRLVLGRPLRANL